MCQRLCIHCRPIRAQAWPSVRHVSRYRRQCDANRGEKSRGGRVMVPRHVALGGARAREQPIFPALGYLVGPEISRANGVDKYRKIWQKSIQNLFKNETNMGIAHGIDFSWIFVDFWRQVGAKLDQTSTKKTIQTSIQK